MRRINIAAIPTAIRSSIWTGDPTSDLTTRRDSAVDYFDGET